MSRYPIKASYYSSHSQILRVMGAGEGRKLLDVGCADGTLSEQFLSDGWKVTGIEPFPDDARIARERGVSIIEMPLEDGIEHLEFEYDAMVLADVLEHCADPWTQLRRLVAYCRSDSIVVISLPNVAHVITRLHLLLGRFNYVDRGILDRTHLRFFTRSTALQLVESAGLNCLRLTVTPTPVELVFPTLMHRWYGRAFLSLLATFTSLFPRILGYQFVMTCGLGDRDQHHVKTR